MFHLYDKEGVEITHTKNKDEALQWLHDFPNAAWVAEVKTIYNFTAFKGQPPLHIQPNLDEEKPF